MQLFAGWILGLLALFLVIKYGVAAGIRSANRPPPGRTPLFESSGEREPTSIREALLPTVRVIALTILVVALIAAAVIYL